MADTQFVIGGKTIMVPVMNLKAIRTYGRRAKDLAALVGLDPDQLDPELVDSSFDATLDVVAVALESSDCPMTVDEINVAVRGMPELMGLSASLQNLLRESGLLPTGEAPPAGENAQAGQPTS